MGYKKLTQDEKAAIIALYKTGREPKEIAAMLNRSANSVNKVRLESGVEPHKKKRSECSKQIQKAMQASRELPQPPDDKNRAVVDCDFIDSICDDKGGRK